MATGHDDDDDDEDDDADDAHADDDDDHLRAACYPRAAVSKVTLGGHFGRERDVELEAEDGSASEVRTRTGSATLCCVGLPPLEKTVLPR